MNVPRIVGVHATSIRFCLLFMCYLGLLALALEWRQDLFGTAYMYPVSAVAAFLLNTLGIPAELLTEQIPHGFCELLVSEIIYRVTFDCTGIFALQVFVALTLAYPAATRAKGEALLLGVPAIFVFSSLRLVVLGMVAQFQPQWIDLFHVYVMELATLGFMLFVWKYWIDELNR